VDSQDPNEIQEADTPLFNSDEDEDFLAIAREMDMMEEDKKLFKEVTIQSSELSSFIGSDVIITLKGDQRDHPSIYGIVRGVNDEAMLLMPTKVDNIKIPKTTINIKDISKCTTVPEDWEQHEKGPADYVAQTIKVERPATNSSSDSSKRQNRHKRNKSEGRIYLHDGNRSVKERSLNIPSSPTRNRYRPLDVQMIQPITRQPEIRPPLVRTNSIYPNLEGVCSFSLVVKGAAVDLDTRIKLENDNPDGNQETNAEFSQDPEPKTDQEKILQRKDHWLSHFLVEYVKETERASLEGRIANLYKATERAAEISLLTIQRTILYKFKFHPELKTPPTVLAAQLWNHFESYGFDLSINTSTFKCKEPSKPYLHPETRKYIGTPTGMQIGIQNRTTVHSQR
jgi:hypothetical protein